MPSFQITYSAPWYVDDEHQTTWVPDDRLHGFGFQGLDRPRGDILILPGGFLFRMIIDTYLCLTKYLDVAILFTVTY